MEGLEVKVSPLALAHFLAQRPGLVPGGTQLADRGDIGCAAHSPTLTRLFEDEASMIDDMAESVVIKAMQEGDISAAKWWLERRRRGKYATKTETEVSGSDGGPLRVIIEYEDAGYTDNHPTPA